MSSDDTSKCGQCKINAQIDTMKFTEPIYHVHREHETEKDCNECKNNKRIRVRDHCHILSNFRGAAHQDCNLQYNIKESNWKLPCFLHNMKGYDGHLLIRALKPRHGE